MVNEFKEFIARGNVMELAVAVIIGAAFSGIVNSLVEDVITPAFLNPVMERLNVEQLALLEWNGIKYGSFLAAVLSFLVIAVVVFLVVRTYNSFMERFEKPEDDEPPGKTPELVTLEEIRDLLSKQSST